MRGGIMWKPNAIKPPKLLTPSKCASGKGCGWFGGFTDIRNRQTNKKFKAS